MSRWLVERSSAALERRVSRRSFLGKSAVVGSALTVAPTHYLLRPGTAYAAICRCAGSACDCGSRCCDGYTEFCCVVHGHNSCPPGSFVGGWWKADNTYFCSSNGTAPRYYLDCNRCQECGCGCARASCNNRRRCCNHFRYGNCNRQIPCTGVIDCRVVTCTPPWVFDPGCTTTSLTDNATRTHDAACLHEPPLPPACAGEVPGYVLDGYGGLHPRGGAAPATGGPYWRGWDIARDVATRPGTSSGWVLDGYGGVHPFNGAPAVVVSGYWRGWDIAKALTANPHGPGGWVLDGYGGVHPFGGAPWAAHSAYWSGWDIARDLMANPAGPGGWVLDGYGGLHPFGDAPRVAPSAYWAGWDIARKLIPNPSGPGGWVLDGYGGLHPFGGAPPAAPTPGYPLRPTRDAAVGGGGGHVVTGHGQLAVLGTSCVTAPIWRGWDIARAFAPVG